MDSFIGNFPNPINLDPLTTDVATRLATSTAQVLTAVAQGQARANIGADLLGSFRNKLINGDFRVWQRGNSQTASGYGSDDRWNNANTGSGKTHTRQAFTPGQTEVPGNPLYFSRTVVTSVAGSSNFVIKRQSIEAVDSLSGKTVTVTFYAKADANKNMAVEFYRNHGAGGSSPESTPVGLAELTTSWKRFDFVITLPSVVGKTIGAGSHTELNLWFDCGSTYLSRAFNLGQQSGTFDIAHVSVVEGDASKESDPFGERHVALELMLCQRYYTSGNIYGWGHSGGTGNNRAGVERFKVTMRTTPTISVNNVSGTNISGSTALEKTSSDGFSVFIYIPAVGSYYLDATYTADAEL